MGLGFVCAAGVPVYSLRDGVLRADFLFVPVAPSVFDTSATERFLGIIAEYKAVKQGELAVGRIGMRVDARTRAAGELDEFLGSLDFPRVANLRDTQVYVYCARDGLSIFDLPRSRAEQDTEQWRPLARWIARHAKVRA